MNNIRTIVSHHKEQRLGTGTVLPNLVIFIVVLVGVLILVARVWLIYNVPDTWPTWLQWLLENG